MKKLNDEPGCGGQGDGFEGNAHNLRLLGYLEIHRDGFGSGQRGLHLTRAALAATIKYPWTRGQEPDPQYEGKWGAFEPERKLLDWVLEDRPQGGPLFPVEKEIMDWADDVTYAVHDMEDFYQHGLIPLDRLLNFTSPGGSAEEESAELERFLNCVQDEWQPERHGGQAFVRSNAVAAMQRVSQLVSVTEPFHGTREHRALLDDSVSQLIAYFIEGVSLADGAYYDGELTIDPDRRFICDLLKKLVFFYVIERPALAGQQRGQQQVVHDLLTWHAEDAMDRGLLLPDDRREELADHGLPLRAACDHVASLTEAHALALHRRLGGHDPGSVTDLL